MTEQTVMSARERLERDAVDFLRGACPEDAPQFVTNCIAIVRAALIPSLSKYAYEQSTPVALSELDGSPTWEEACARQHSITAYISSDIYKLINAAFGKDPGDG